jgi:glutamate synthase (NADPH/NADH) large chain
VTNPAIDPIREKLVMNVNVYLGRKLNWLEESPEHARQLRINSPVLTNEQLQEIRQLDSPHLRSDTISCCFKISDGTLGLEKPCSPYAGRPMRKSMTVFRSLF